MVIFMEPFPLSYGSPIDVIKEIDRQIDGERIESGRGEEERMREGQKEMERL